MNNNTFLAMAKAVKEKFESKNGTSAAEFKASLNILKEMFDPSYNGPRVPFRELMTANDFGVLFQKVITDNLQQPVEPQYLGVSLFSKTIQISGAQTIRFPMINAITAEDIPLGQPIPRRDFSLTEQMVTFDSTRSGVAFDLDPELLNESVYNLLAFYTEAGRRALVRWKEEKVWDGVMNLAHTIYDNELASAEAWTSGMGPDGLTRNGSLAYDDLIEMQAQVLTNGYSVTDMLLNPLGWSILHRDPILRAQWMHQGQIGSQIWAKAPELGSSSLMPWGINYIPTRFMKAYTDVTRTICGVTGTAGNFVDILMVDRNNPVIIFQKDPVSLDRWDVKETDITTIAMKERYSVYANEAARSAVMAKSIHLAKNDQPVITVNSIIPA